MEKNLNHKDKENTCDIFGVVIEDGLENCDACRSKYRKQYYKVKPKDIKF